MHVLGTPPAFILSQDQTLIKSVWPSSEWADFNLCSFRYQPAKVDNFYCFIRMFFLASLRKNDLNSKFILRLRLVFIKNLMSRLYKYYYSYAFVWIFKIVSLFNYQSSLPQEPLIYYISSTFKFWSLARQRIVSYHRTDIFVNNFFKVF